jgi:hypothetical protein
MTVTKLLGTLLIVGACGDPGPPRKPLDDAPVASVDAHVWPDASPPPFDAAPLPELACAPTEMPCPLPPSRCLDSHYLIYYTNGSCVDDNCTFDEHWTYCFVACVSYGHPQDGAGCYDNFT